MIEDNGTIAGNITDKYNTQNPIFRLMMENFLASAKSLILPIKKEITSVTEVGCGEGHFSVELASWGFDNIRACDFSTPIIQKARETHRKEKINFYPRSIYDINTEDAADLMICVEVLEHLKQPREALRQLNAQTKQYCLLSVPNEPWWRMANMLRGKYLRDLGNTPGHLQHWSTRHFRSLISEYFEITAIRTPFPWTMILGRKRNNI